MNVRGHDVTVTRSISQDIDSQRAHVIVAYGARNLQLSDLVIQRVNQQRLVEAISYSAVSPHAVCRITKFLLLPAEPGSRDENDGVRDIRIERNLCGDWRSVGIATGIAEWADWNAASSRVSIEQGRYLIPPSSPIFSWLDEQAMTLQEATRSSGSRPMALAAGDVEPFSEPLGRR